MRTDQLADLVNPVKRVPTLQAMAIARVAGAMSATLTDPSLNQRLQGRALSGQFMGMAQDGLAKLKVGNMVLKVLLPIGAKPPPIGAPMVVNIVSQDSAVKQRSAVSGQVPEAESGFEKELQVSRQNIKGQATLLDSGRPQTTPLPRAPLTQSPLSPTGQLFAQVLQNFHPREGAKLLLFASQVGLLTDAVTNQALNTSNTASAAGAAGKPSMTPLLEVLGLKAPSAEQFAAKTGEFAAQLSQAIKHSGLFYESQLAQWKTGRLSKAELMLNPQTDWGADTKLQPGSQPLNEAQTKASNLANQQLNLLQHPKIQLTLPGLHGEPMDLSLFNGLVQAQEEEREGKRHAPSEEEKRELAKQWHFELNLNLPTLGKLSARLSMTQTYRRLLLQAKTETVPWLALHDASLKEALQLDSLQIVPLPDENH